MKDLESRHIRVIRFKISLPLKSFHDVGLFGQHKPFYLGPDLRKAPPTIEVLRVPLIAMSLSCMFPMPLGEAEEGRDLFVGYVVDQGAYGSSFPVSTMSVHGPGRSWCHDIL